MATSPVRKGFIRRLMSWRGALFLLAAFITLVALLFAEEDWRGGRAWQNYKREMEAKGERFDMARLIPPKVPDDQNFAATPYFAPVFNLPPEVLRQPLKLVTNIVNGQPEVLAMLITRGTNIATRLPDPIFQRHPAGWYIGSATDLLAWAAAFQGTNSPAPRPKITDPVQAAAIVLAHLADCEPTLKELQSASLRPFSRFNLPYEEWGNRQVESALLEHFVLIKGLFHLLSLHAEAEMVSGHAEQALKDINVMFRLDDGLKDEPVLISQWIRLTGMSTILQPVGEGLAEHRWSEAQLRVLQERLQKTDLIASMVRAWYGERDIITNPAFNRGNMNPEGRNMVPRGWVRLEQLNINLAFHDLLLPRIDLAAREINPSVNHSVDLALKKISAGNGFRVAFIKHSFLARMLLPALSRAPQKTAFVQSEVDLTMLACALERYRLTEGHYPKELNALVSSFVAILPHDIINGQPLKYRRTDDGRFILYSVGWNEKDDGGIIALTKDKYQDVTQGDWVFSSPTP